MWSCRLMSTRQPQENNLLSTTSRLLLRILACDDKRAVRPSTSPFVVPNDHHLLLHRLCRGHGYCIREAGGGCLTPKTSKRKERPSCELEVDVSSIRLPWRRRNRVLFHHELLVRLDELSKCHPLYPERIKSDQMNQKTDGCIGTRNARVFLSRRYGLASVTFRRISAKTRTRQS